MSKYEDVTELVAGVQSSLLLSFLACGFPSAFVQFPPGGKGEPLGALKPTEPRKFMKMRRSATSAPL